MVLYNFKSIQTVPAAKDFIDIALSKTQRKTPTVVHKGYKITRIRAFYMRKVKFAQTTYHERLTNMLTQFPRLDDIHPFYADLMNVLYDRDHYKVALSQLSNVKNTVDQIGREYVRLLKYGDSLYRCKQLKRAALGRMSTCVKKLDSSLKYLEQVRQHLARLPSIDPNTRTLLVTGYPNVGKSSFLNRLTKADVEVQPYAFTTRSLYVGHTDYQYVRWQVIDTPGILDHPLEERNTIEMQAITALAHLQACVIYFLDLSGTCGYTVDQQCSLFTSIQSLFAGKPLVIVVNKTDLMRLEDASPEDQAAVKKIVGDSGATLMCMSTQTADGVATVKQTACDLLLAHREDQKLRSKRFEQVQNRIYTAVPEHRDDNDRPLHIPESVLQGRDDDMGELRETELDLERAAGGAGQYSGDLRKHYDLRNPEWKYDVIPEVVEGMNVADFVDGDIEQKLRQLEEEEEMLLKEEALEMANAPEVFTLSECCKSAAHVIKDRLAIQRLETALKRSRSNSRPKTKAMQDAIDAHHSRVGRKRSRSASCADPELIREKEENARSLSRRHSMPPTQFGLQSEAQVLQTKTLNKKRQKFTNKQAKKGPGDHHIPNLMPKHLFSGKMNTKGKRDRR